MHRRTFRTAILLSAAALMAAAAALVWPSVSARVRYTGLAASDASRLNGAEGSRDLVAWLDVEGTSISYPVVTPEAGDPDDFYLEHDYWRRSNPLGTPYLERRCTRAGDRLMVYGHNDKLTGGMFAPLAKAERQDGFDTIGDAIWTSPDGTKERFSPLFAIKVDEQYAPALSFADSSVGLTTLLEQMSKDAIASTDGWEDDSKDAQRVLALVTCSTGRMGGSDRTIVVFSAP